MKAEAEVRERVRPGLFLLEQLLADLLHVGQEGQVLGPQRAGIPNVRPGHDQPVLQGAWLQGGKDHHLEGGGRRALINGGAGRRPTPSFPPTHLVILKGHCGLSEARLIGRNVAEEALLHRHAVSLVLHAFA